MAVSTYTALAADSQTIKNETTLNANTADRVGSLFENIVDTIFTTQDTEYRKTFTRAELLSLYATPYELIAGEAGTLISLERAYYKYTYDTAQIGIGTLTIKYETTLVTASDSVNFDSEVVSKINCQPAREIINQSVNLLGDSIILTADDATPSGGGAATTLEVVLHYKLISL